MNNTYNTLLHNATLGLSILLLSIIGTNIYFTITAPVWQINSFCLLCAISSIISALLLNKVISNITTIRNHLILINWIGSFLCMTIGTIPLLFYIYINMDWKLLITYGDLILKINYSLENLVIPIALMILMSIVYWTLTIQLYNKSYLTYLCIKQKKEIYER